VADTGADPEPLQRLSTRKVYVVTRRLDAQLNPTQPARQYPILQGKPDCSRRYFVSTAPAPIVEVVKAQVDRLQLGAHDFEQISVVVLFLSGRHPIRIVVLCK
jgi:hypothetical protein